MPLFESKRRVQAMGSSLAITLPAFFVKANEIEKGKEIKVFYNLDDVLVAYCDEAPESLIERLKTIITRLEEKNPA